MYIENSTGAKAYSLKAAEGKGFIAPKGFVKDARKNRPKKAKKPSKK